MLVYEFQNFLIQARLTDHSDTLTESGSSFKNTNLCAFSVFKILHEALLHGSELKAIGSTSKAQTRFGSLIQPGGEGDKPGHGGGLKG